MPIFIKRRTIRVGSEGMMTMKGAAIIQRDGTVLLDKQHPCFEEVRLELIQFAELVKSPAFYYTYKITPLSVWNAVANGWTGAEVVEVLQAISRFNLPSGLIQNIVNWIARHGKLRLLSNETDPNTLELVCTLDEKEANIALEQMATIPHANLKEIAAGRYEVSRVVRGVLKQQMLLKGYPIVDEAGYRKGAPLSFSWKTSLATGQQWQLRSYQREAANAFVGEGTTGGSGVIVMPCGAGKTIVGLAVMEKLQCETLILTSNLTSVHQWIHEMVTKTTISPGQIGEYSGQQKQVMPVTVSTYQMLTYRKQKNGEQPHLDLFNQREWGLIIYDEVHLLPAPVFRATADIQGARRLGLTATLVREDGCEKDVFSLIGPKWYDLPWRELEEDGYIASAKCYEIRVGMSSEDWQRYEQSEPKFKFRLAAENKQKLSIIKELIQRHPHRQILIIGQYVNQLRHIATELGAPVITGSMPQLERDQLFEAYRQGQISILIVSKIANFAVNLPDASVAIQISGSYGSRQEEAQRLGRILRPKAGLEAYFYSIVSEDTREQEFAAQRQLFLLEQGYEYQIVGSKE